MKKVFKKAIAVLLALCLVFSICTVGVFAEEKTAKDAVASLEKDIPIVEIPGFGEAIYKGLSTETEEDDKSIWELSASDILPLVLKHFPSLVYSLIVGNFEKLDVILTDVLGVIFGGAVCDENGVPNPDTGIKAANHVVPKREYGYRNSYSFHYDWRLDMHTIASQLHEFILHVMETTGSDRVGLVSFSMGGSVMMTYLYEYYYSADAEARKHIDSAIFLAGAMNGVGCCEDPFSGNIVFDSTSVFRLLHEAITSNPSTAWLYNIFDIIYRLGAVEPLVSYLNNTLVENLDVMSDNCITASVGTIPGFYALMSRERYYEAESFNFNTDEDRSKFATLLEKNRYYHDMVQANSDNIIASLIDDGKNFAVISEYGYPMIPVTSDNARMADGTIATDRTSFGATCAKIDETLGDNYSQAVQCSCGKNHVSPDNQIDASTCKYPDVTWFAKNVRHSCSDEYFADIIDIITYSDEQVTVHTYPDIPQFMINYEDSCLVPMDSTNAGEIIPFHETTILGKFFKEIFG